MDMETNNCRKCNGTGYLPHFARTDGGKCWACTDKADTSYTRNIPTLTDAEAAERWAAHVAEVKARRKARKAQP